MRRISLLCALLTCGLSANAEVKIASAVDMAANPLPEPDAMLEIASSNKGFLLPRVALSSTTLPAPLSTHVPGMEVFNTATTGDVSPCIYHNDGTKWVSECDPATEWSKLDGSNLVDAGDDKVTAIQRVGDVGINSMNEANFFAKEELEIHSRTPGILLNDNDGFAVNSGIFFADFGRFNWSIQSDNSNYGNNMTFVNSRPYGNFGGFKWMTTKSTETAWVNVPNQANAGAPLGALALTRSIQAMFLSQTGNLTIAGTLTQSSDERLKNNIVEMDSALDKVDRIKPVYFNWKADPNEERQREIGFTAQNVEEVLPELVRTSEEDGMKSVAYANMTPVLVKAIQELREELLVLKDENARLHDELEMVNQKIESDADAKALAAQ